MPPRGIASLLMLATGAAHVVHFFVLGMAGAAAGLGLFGLFGLFYLAIGVLLRRPGKLGLWLGAVIPALGGLGGLQLLLGGLTFAMLAYVVVDVVVAAICIALLVRGEKPAAATSSTG